MQTNYSNDAYTYDTYQETLSLVGVSPDNLVRTVPLPSAANRSGPVLVHPPNTRLEEILRVVSTPVVCVQEVEMKPMISLTGHISSFFELMNASQDFIVEGGKYNVGGVLCSVLRTVYYILYTMHYILYTMYYILCGAY
jgi:hypothetical protein